MRLSAACAILLFGSGCFEYPPVIPPDYVGSPAAPGWPPLAVYDADPFHPANRWFQRAFGGRGAEQSILPAHADEPLGLVNRPTAVDLAEWEALLQRFEHGAWPAPPAGSREAVTRAVLRSDLLAEASRLRAELQGDADARELASRFASAARYELDAASFRGAACPPEAVPPPLRDGEWADASPPAVAGLIPSPFDPRWARLLRRAGDERWSALERLRVVVNGAGAPELLGIASECWELRREEDGVARSVWRFDRAEWLQGREAWRRVPDDAEISIRSPVDPSVVLRGPAARLCASCHCGEPTEASSELAARAPPSAAVSSALAQVLAP